MGSTKGKGFMNHYYCHSCKKHHKTNTKIASKHAYQNGFGYAIDSKYFEMRGYPVAVFKTETQADKFLTGNLAKHFKVIPILEDGW